MHKHENNFARAQTQGETNLHLQSSSGVFPCVGAGLRGAVSPFLLPAPLTPWIQEGQSSSALQNKQTRKLGVAWGWGKASKTPTSVSFGETPSFQCSLLLLVVNTVSVRVLWRPPFLHTHGGVSLLFQKVSHRASRRLVLHLCYPSLLK